jgi:hypothetical protein
VENSCECGNEPGKVLNDCATGGLSSSAMSPVVRYFYLTWEIT